MMTKKVIIAMFISIFVAMLCVFQYIYFKNSLLLYIGIIISSFWVGKCLNLLLESRDIYTLMRLNTMNNFNIYNILGMKNKEYTSCDIILSYISKFWYISDSGIICITDKDKIDDQILVKDFNRYIGKYIKDIGEYKGCNFILYENLLSKQKFVLVLDLYKRCLKTADNKETTAKLKRIK